MSTNSKDRWPNGNAQDVLDGQQMVADQVMKRRMDMPRVAFLIKDRINMHEYYGTQGDAHAAY